jgi:hypothetical protein
LPRGFRPRFGGEAAFLILVAVAVGLLELDWPVIVVVMCVAWLLLVALEVVTSRVRPSGAAGGGRAVGPVAERVAPMPASAAEPAEWPAPAADLEPAGEPEPAAPFLPARPPAASPTPDIFELPAPGREWNVWELERRARERAGEDPVRDEEWSYLLMYLREFANADGNLPRDFDPLVRESFDDLIRAR